MITHWSESLTKLHACYDAVGWARSQPSLRTAWAKCPRGDWLLWYAATRGVDREMLVQAACDAAEVAWDHVEPPLAAVLAIYIAREWAAGREDLETVRAAAGAASASAYTLKRISTAASYCADAAGAAGVAESAADAAYAAIYAIAARVARADYATNPITYADARAEALAETARRVRARISFEALP